MHNALVDGLIRKLWIAEADHLSRPPAPSRPRQPAQPVRRRGVGRLHPRLRRCHLSAQRRGAWLFRRRQLRGAAELRPLGPALGREAEAALSIETPWQSHGVGSELLDRTLLAARNRGIKTLHMACLANNRRMQELARKFTAELSFDFGSVVGEVAAPRPTPLSVLREFVADGHGFATAVLDVQSRLFRPV